jgi:hypothetical protein
MFCVGCSCWTDVEQQTPTKQSRDLKYHKETQMQINGAIQVNESKCRNRKGKLELFLGKGPFVKELLPLFEGFAIEQKPRGYIVYY